MYYVTIYNNLIFRNKLVNCNQNVVVQIKYCKWMFLRVLLWTPVQVK